MTSLSQILKQDKEKLMTRKINGGGKFAEVKVPKP